MSSSEGGFGVSHDVFQSIILERAGERRQLAEERRLNDMRMISDLRSELGVDPLERFPKEIWENILGYLALSSPESLQNISTVHHLFREILERDRVRDILFPQIVRFNDVNQSNEIVARFFIIHRRSPFAHNLELRSVSRSMRNAVDRWYENNLVKKMRMVLSPKAEIKPLQVPGIEISIYDKELLDKMLADYNVAEPTSAKRFISRSLNAVLLASSRQTEELPREEYENLFRTFTDKITSLLEIIGDQIWHFEYKLDFINEMEENGVTATQLYTVLQRWALHMPNLKWLEITLPDKAFQWAMSKMKKEPKLIALTTLEDHPFPKLQHLERVCFHMSAFVEGIYGIYEAVLNANPHVQILNYGKKLFLLNQLADPDSAAKFQLLNNINTLYLSNMETKYSPIALFLPLGNLNWPLKRFQAGISLGYCSINTLFRFLEKFPSLEYVELSIDSVTIADEITFLMLPNLGEFKLQLNHPTIEYSGNVHFFFSLQFLLHSKNLKKLAWELRLVSLWKLRRLMKNRECQERMINFRAGLRKLKYSNIWDVFPSLDNVTVTLSETKKCSLSPYGLPAKVYKRADRD